jgi:hypothetical protein
MTDIFKIARFSISTRSIDPPRGVVEIDTETSTLRFELNEDLAHSLCADLERFLTQPAQRSDARSAGADAF